MCKMEMKESDVKFFDNYNFRVWWSDILYDYKQLPSNTKIGDPTKSDRYCEVCQGYLSFSNLVWWYVILIVIIEI